MNALDKKQRISLAGAIAASVAAGVLTLGHLGGPIVTFLVAGVALALLAMLVGDATEELGTRLGPGATGVLQSALGNLPELFVCIFSLRAGLVTVVQSALVGSILANSLLVLGLAFLVGGIKHGTQKFAKEAPRMMAVLMLLAIAGLVIPTLGHQLHTSADRHGDSLSIICAVVLLVVFACSIPVSIKGEAPVALSHEAREGARAAHGASWPLWLAVVILVIAGVGAAVVSDWFVEALTPFKTAVGLSDAFMGLVIVAIAGNAVENVVGIQLAAANKPDYAVSIILNSSLQIALGLIPVLVLLSFVLGGAHLTLVLPPMLLAALLVGVIVTTFIIFDGESIWLEGAALIGLYVIIAASFWWG